MCDEITNLVLDKLYLPNEGKLIPEPDESGNIEYKLRLDKKDMMGRDKMVSQMLWRMNEGRNQFGRYEAHYILGINDNGTFSDMTEIELTTTTNIFRGIVKKANAKIISEKIYVFPSNKMIMHLIVRRDFSERHIPELDIIIMGPPDAGKSSLMGRLTYGQRDDGNGFSRKLILRHAHERISGTTSCPKYDTIGFVGPNVMNYSIGIDFNMEDVYRTSDRMINLIDMPGDMKYIKTILYSISSLNPDHIIVCIPFRQKSGGNYVYTMTIEDVINMYKDHYMFIMSLCITYKLQPIFVLTKCDHVHERSSAHDNVRSVGMIFNEWKTQLMNSSTIPLVGSDGLITEAVTKSVTKSVTESITESVWGEEITDTLQDTLQATLYHTRVTVNDDIDFTKSPCIEVSNITGEAYDALLKILSDLKPKPIKTPEKDKLFIINDVFTIPDIGQIFHGTLRYGVINIDENILILCHGQLFKKQVKSIHRKTLDVDKLSPGESGSITFHGNIDKNLDKTATIIDELWITKMITNIRIKSVFNTIKLKPQQYMLFVDNSILTVIIGAPDEYNVHPLTSVNNVKFLLDTNIGMLKDDQHNYYFINFV